MLEASFGEEDVSPAPRRSVLVVDDDEDCRDLVASTLRRAGYEVRCADSGARALALLHDMRPALMLVDLKMPLMSGAELMTLIARHPELQPFAVIAMSGSLHQRASPAKWFLRKPLDLQLLVTVVRDFCGSGCAVP